MTIIELEPPLECMTLDEAARRLGGDRPFSRSTIQRMVAAGVLEARGAGKLRRITARSLTNYQQGVTTWDGSADQAAAGRTKAVNGGRSSRSAAASSGGLVVLTGRRPKPR